jgi:hypothetical protein
MKQLSKLWTHFIGEENIILLEGSQASPTRPSDKSSMKVETIKWQEMVVWVKRRWIQIFLISGELHNLER